MTKRCLGLAGSKGEEDSGCKLKGNHCCCRYKIFCDARRNWLDEFLLGFFVRFWVMGRLYGLRAPHEMSDRKIRKKMRERVIVLNDLFLRQSGDAEERAISR